MNKNEFLKAMDELDEKYAAEAAGYKKKKKKMTVLRYSSLAACAIIAFVGIFGMIKGGSEGTKEYKSADYASHDEEIPEYAIAETAAGLVQEDSDYEYSGDSNREQMGSEGGYGSEVTNTDAALVSHKGVEVTAIDTAKIIYTATFKLESQEFDSAYAKIEEIVKGSAGFFQDNSVYGDDPARRSASITIRVPVEKYDSVVAQLKEVGYVTFFGQEANNISEQYADIENRLNTAKTKLERLQQLLKDAQDMSDIITIQNAISDAEWEVDSYSSALRSYDNQVNYSTVELSLTEVAVYTPSDPEPITFGERIGNAFKNGLTAIGDGFIACIYWAVANIVWIILIAAAVVTAVVIIKKKRRK